MKLLDNTKMSVKIVSLLVMLGLITMFIAWNGSRRLLSADTDYSMLIDPKLKTVARVVGARRAMSDMLYASYRVLAYDGDSPQARASVEAEKAAYKDAVDLLTEAKKADAVVAEKMDDYIAKANAIHDLTARSEVFGLRNDDASTKALLAQADHVLDPVAKDIAAFADARSTEADKRSDELTDQANATATMLLTMSVLGVAGGIGLAYLVTRLGITGPLARLQRRMSEIATGEFGGDVVCARRGDEIGPMGRAVQVFRENGIAMQAADAAKARADAEQKMVVDTVSSHLSDLSGGDLTATITTDFPREYAVLKSNFNEALDKLRELIGSVSESAATIRTGSGEIAQASEDLARRTESNAASLEETAASVTQMDGRLKASAQAASRTVERADQAIATVGGGRAVADEAVQAMGRVSDSAKGIDSVIEGLDKIAFQTRVLAMNAAVEAGRAGDAGRGFAVVADLVSALAMRAEEEAKRARDQLTVTQTDIVTAVEAVQKVDGALSDISGDVGQVHELLATMAADNQAQSAAITQISAAIGTMDQATQQNAAMVEETSAAARNLSSEVGSLSDKASRFKVGQAAHASYTPPARPATPSNRAMVTRTSSYTSPVKPLPAAAVAALVRSDDEWKDF